MGRGGTLTLSPPECLYPADSRLRFAGPHARFLHAYTLTLALWAAPVCPEATLCRVRFA